MCISQQVISLQGTFPGITGPILPIMQQLKLTITMDMQEDRYQSHSHFGQLPLSLQRTHMTSISQAHIILEILLFICR